MRLDSGCNVCDEDNVMKIEDCLHFHCDTARKFMMKTRINSKYGSSISQKSFDELTATFKPRGTDVVYCDTDSIKAKDNNICMYDQAGTLLKIFELIDQLYEEIKKIET